MHCKNILISSIPTNKICPGNFPVITLSKYVLVYPDRLKGGCCLFPWESQYDHFMRVFVRYWRRIRVNWLHIMLMFLNFSFFLLPKCIYHIWDIYFNSGTSNHLNFTPYIMVDSKCEELIYALWFIWKWIVWPGCDWTWPCIFWLLCIYF